MIFLSAFVLGLLSSLHCIGMCGPIAASISFNGNAASHASLGRALYNLGRLMMYMLIGLLFGFFGAGLKMAGLQQTISIASGVLMLIIILSKGRLIEKYASKHLYASVYSRLGKLLKNNHPYSVFLIGFVNGLLPCGMVYAAASGSIATQNTAWGALFMLCFGVGTLPAMLSVAYLPALLSKRSNWNFRKIIPAMAICISFIFILRGLNLGIPYLSPKISADKTTVKECCKPQ
jgi:sulfite exporter TauE/SafE